MFVWFINTFLPSEPVRGKRPACIREGGVGETDSTFYTRILLSKISGSFDDHRFRRGVSYTVEYTKLIKTLGVKKVAKKTLYSMVINEVVQYSVYCTPYTFMFILRNPSTVVIINTVVYSNTRLTHKHWRHRPLWLSTKGYDYPSNPTFLIDKSGQNTLSLLDSLSLNMVLVPEKKGGHKMIYTQFQPRLISFIIQNNQTKFIKK